MRIIYSHKLLEISWWILENVSVWFKKLSIIWFPGQISIRWNIFLTQICCYMRKYFLSWRLSFSDNTDLYLNLSRHFIVVKMKAFRSSYVHLNILRNIKYHISIASSRISPYIVHQDSWFNRFMSWFKINIKHLYWGSLSK